MRLVKLLTVVLVVASLEVACVRSPISPSSPPGPVISPPPIPPPPPPKLSVTRVLAFGDSMTEGTISPALIETLTAGIPASYPAKLQDRLTTVYTGQTMVVLNGGKAGEWAVDGVNRLPDVMRDAQPDVLLLMEGVNDLNGLSAQGNAAIAPTIGALESMIKYAKARGVPVFVATLPPQRPGGLRAGSVTLLPRFNDEVRKTVIDEGATLVDVNAVFDPGLIGQDGLHPTEAGYARLSEIFFDAIKQAFEQPGGLRPPTPSAALSFPESPEFAR